MLLVEARFKEPIDTVLRRLYYDEGKSLDEVAVAIDMPAGTVSTWMIKLGLNLRAIAERAAKERAS